jgi:hypothetical protein
LLNRPEVSPEPVVDVSGGAVGCGPGLQCSSQGLQALEAALTGGAFRHMLLHALGLGRLELAVEPGLEFGILLGTAHAGVPPSSRGSV